MIMHDDDVVVLLPPALRVSPAETRLTVYRRPHIRAQAAVRPGWAARKFNANVFSNCNFSAPRASQDFSSGQNGAIWSKFMPS